MRSLRSVPVLALAILALVPGGAALAQNHSKTSAIESMLPPNTIAYAHIRVPELAASEQFAFTRKILQSAGADARKEFDRHFGNLFAKMETLTIIFPEHGSIPMLPNGRPESRTVLWVVRTSAPIDRVALMKTLLRQAVTKKHRGCDYYFDDRTWSGTLFLDAHTLVYASEDSLMTALDQKADATEKGVLARSLAEDAGKSTVYVAIDPATFQRPELLREVPEALTGLFRAKTWAFSASLGAETRLTARMDFASAEQASDGQKSIQFAIALVQSKIDETLKKVAGERKGPPRLPTDFVQSAARLLGIGTMRYAQEELKALPIEVKGSAVQASINVDATTPHVLAGVQAIYLMIAPVMVTERVYFSDQKFALEDRLRRQAQVVEALERYNREKGEYPAPAISGADGKPLLSWRVALLPYMGGPEKQLYDQFRLNEPWDSPANRKLLPRMPYHYGETWRDGPRTGTQYVTGPDTLFPANRSLNKGNLGDRLDHAVLLVQAENPDSFVLWTKPADVAYDPKRAMPDLMDAGHFKGLLLYTLDGNQRLLPEDFSRENFRALFAYHARKPLTNINWQGTVRRVNPNFYEKKEYFEKKTEPAKPFGDEKKKPFDEKIDKKVFEEKTKKGVWNLVPMRRAPFLARRDCATPRVTARREVLRRLGSCNAHA